MNRCVSFNLDSVNGPVPECNGDRARVLFLSSTVLGMAVRAEQLVEATAARDDIDATHVLLRTPSWMKVAGKRLGASGRDRHALRHMTLWRREIRRWLRGPLDTGRFDAVHVLGGAYAPGVIDAAPDLPLIVNADSTAALEQREFGRRGHDTVIRAERRTFQAAQLVCCWSEWARRSVVSDYGVDPERTVIAPPWVGPAPRTAPVPAGPVRVGFIGGDFVRKGGPLLARVLDERCELHVVGPKRRPRGLPAGAVWHGNVTRDRLLNDLLPTFDLLLLPSREETFGIASIEAQSAGVPVVVSDVGGLPETLDPGVTGLVVPVGDARVLREAINTLVSDPARRTGMGEAARVWVKQRFDPKSGADALLDAVLAAARGGAVGGGRVSYDGRPRRETDGAAGRGAYGETEKEDRDETGIERSRGEAETPRLR